VAFWAVLLGLAAVACGGGIPREELPSEPIAFIRREPRMGIGNLDEFMGAIRMNMGGATEEQRPVPPTTVTLLTPSTGQMQPVPDSGAGTYPLDWSSDGLYLLVGRTARQQRGTLELFSWNRLTGAYDRLARDRISISASLGSGPIRLAHVGPLLRPGRTPTSGIFVQVDRSGFRALPDSVGGDTPDVSPDGQTVVFVRASPPPRGGRDPIILLGELGSERARPVARGMNPRFSRDGEWIAYESRRRGNSDVWLMRSDGSSKRPIADSSFDEEFPAASPKGRYVVYSAVRGSSKESQLFMTRVSDGVEIQLTRTGQNGRPVW
jgi:dipeptidyl aminopeptidase/acylaminoacyl peptidase